MTRRESLPEGPETVGALYASDLVTGGQHTAV